MCVIFACEKNKFPTFKEMQLAEEMNGDGGGIAWLDEKKQIHFKKGLTASQIQKMIDSGMVKTPCVIHYRITSTGQNIPELTHPFIISKESPLLQEGILPARHSGVLFHNGTYSEYDELLMKAVMMSNSKMLKGEYTDSRVLAFVSALYGHEFLNFIDGWNKFIVLDSDGIHRYGEFGKVSHGVKSSNDYYKQPAIYSDNWYEDEYEEYGIPFRRGNVTSFTSKSIKENLDDGQTTLQTEDDKALSKMFDSEAWGKVKNTDSNDMIVKKYMTSCSKRQLKKIRKKIEYLKANHFSTPESMSLDTLEKSYTSVRRYNKSKKYENPEVLKKRIEEIKTQINEKKNELHKEHNRKYESENRELVKEQTKGKIFNSEFYEDLYESNNYFEARKVLEPN